MTQLSGQRADERQPPGIGQIPTRLMSAVTASARTPRSSTTDLEKALGSEASSAWKARARSAMSCTRTRCSLSSLISPR